jgi:hypothetical protein
MSNLLGLEDKSASAEDSTYETAPDLELEKHAKSGANWFYWIAGLSVVNSLIFVFGGNVSFLAGLGFTLVVDVFIDAAVQAGAPSLFKGISIIFDFVLVVVFALAGYYGGRRFTAAFLIGIGVYVLDGLLVLLLGDLLMAGFHAFALIFIIRGFLACRKLNAIDAAEPYKPLPGTA